MASSFGHPCSATLHVVAADGWDFTPYYVARHVLVGSHGSLNRQQSTVPIMFHGPGVRHVELAYGRTVDIVPTILAYFGVESAGLDGRALPIFADMERNRRIAAESRTHFALDQVEDARHIYTLQGYYGQYDRSILRTDKRTRETEVLVESVRETLLALQAKPNITLRLTGIRSPYLLLKTEHLGEDRPATTVRYHVAKREFE
jgi:arylsulfatase A-like enzyme